MMAALAERIGASATPPAAKDLESAASTFKRRSRRSAPQAGRKTPWMKHYYLYAMTWADCPWPDSGPGVDPRFAVELVPCAQLAAVASRVGLDQFDLTKLEDGTADIRQLTEVAVRHNEIVSLVAKDRPVLPARLGTLFQSRPSLAAKLASCEEGVASFLRRLGDRKEWAVKVYLDEDAAEGALAESPPGDDPSAKQFDGSGSCAGEGAQYLAARRLQKDRRRCVQSTVGREVSAIDAHMRSFTDSWHRLPPLPGALTGRPEKMVWNGALLLPSASLRPFLTDCERLRSDLAPKGLILEVTGPWPPYHFCPSLEA